MSRDTVTSTPGVRVTNPQPSSSKVRRFCSLSLGERVRARGLPPSPSPLPICGRPESVGRFMGRGVARAFLRSSRWLLFAVALAALDVCAPRSNAQAAEKTVRVNLGTLAPRGSLYHQSLQAMAEAWRRAPGGGVRLVIYPDGTQGSEADMVRLMRVGSLQAGLLTAVGLSDIEPAVSGLQNIPMLFRSLDEFEHVNELLRPTLEKRLADKGFVVLFWVDAGWVHYFSKEPVLTPDDLRRMKIFVWSGSPDQVSIMRHAGFTPVPLETSDILPGLQTGLITAAPLPPIFALAAQVDLRAPHMLNVNWAPLVGACVVKKDTWDKIPETLREPLLEAATRAGKEIRANSHKESDNAVAAMQKRGLKVHDPSPEVIEQWRKEAEKTWPDIRGRIVPAEIFDQVQEKLQEYRASRK
jgi:TRAP-type C4-dicarboxylate transport system substrate-binding protein